MRSIAHIELNGVRVNLVDETKEESKIDYKIQVDKSGSGIDEVTIEIKTTEKEF